MTRSQKLSGVWCGSAAIVFAAVIGVLVASTASGSFLKQVSQHVLIVTAFPVVVLFGAIGSALGLEGDQGLILVIPSLLTGLVYYGVVGFYAGVGFCILSDRIKKKPNQPPQRNAGSRLVLNEFHRF